jgi:hypothetical protein
MPTNDVRDGVTRLITWLTKHPHIPVDFVRYADNQEFEIGIPAGRFEALTTAADIADTLTNPKIEVTDFRDRRITSLTVTGEIVDHHANSLEAIAACSVYDGARRALLAALGAPPIPDVRVWWTTAEALRTITAERAR